MVSVEETSRSSPPGYWDPWCCKERRLGYHECWWGRRHHIGLVEQVLQSVLLQETARPLDDWSRTADVVFKLVLLLGDRSRGVGFMFLSLPFSHWSRRAGMVLLRCTAGARGQNSLPLELVWCRLQSVDRGTEPHDFLAATLRPLSSPLQVTALQQRRPRHLPR
ncbi:hypothetical protein MTO96_025570 [Rhipicephalus appendiculatus]